MRAQRFDRNACHGKALFGLVTLTLLGAEQCAAHSSESTWQENLWELLNQTVEEIRGQGKAEAPENTAANWRQSPVIASPNGSKAEALRDDAKRLHGAPGLKFESGYGRDIGRDPLEEEEREGFVGLSWDFLDTGYRENQRESELLRERARLAELDGQAEYQARLARKRTEGLAEQLSPLRHDLLNLKRRFLKKILELRRANYLSSEALLDKALETERELKVTRQMLKSLPSKAKAKAHYLPVYEIRLSDVLHRIRKDPLSDRRLRLKRDIHYAQNRLEEGEGHRLKLYTRYEVTPQDLGSGGVGVGFRYSIPMFDNGDHRKKQTLERLRGELRQHAISKQRRRRDTRVAHSEYEGQKIRTIRQHYRYLVALERARRSLTRHRLFPESADIGLAVERVESLLNAAVERVRTLVTLYRRLGMVFESARIPFQRRFIHKLDLPGADHRMRASRRSLYLWSSTLERLNPKGTLALAQARSIDRLLVSVGQNAPAESLFKQVERLSDPLDVEIVRLIGANQWVRTDRLSDASKYLQNLVLPSGGLHLDLEPHALDDFQDKQKLYLKNYLTLVQNASKHVKGSKALSVSVPTIWPKWVYRRLPNLVDRIYIMAYGTNDTSALARHIERVTESLSENHNTCLKVALRFTDFTSEWQLNKAYRKLREKTDVTGLAIHDAAALIGNHRKPTP